MTLPAIFLAALIAVESGGRDYAIGDGGRAYGPLQVRRECLMDVNRAYGTHYTLRDCFDRATSERVCTLYLALYAPNAPLKQKAHVWHYGPTGSRRVRDSRYWNRVESEMFFRQKPLKITISASPGTAGVESRP